MLGEQRCPEEYGFCFRRAFKSVRDWDRCLPFFRGSEGGGVGGRGIVGRVGVGGRRPRLRDGGLQVFGERLRSRNKFSAPTMALGELDPPTRALAAPGNINGMLKGNQVLINDMLQVTGNQGNVGLAGVDPRVMLVEKMAQGPNFNLEKN